MIARSLKTVIGFISAVAIGLVLVIVALVALLALILGPILFWGFVKDVGGDQIERLRDVPAVTLPAGHRVYVALGDSYSSGEGVPPYIQGTKDADEGGDSCHRSRDA